MTNDTQLRIVQIYALLTSLYSILVRLREQHSRISWRCANLMSEFFGWNESRKRQICRKRRPSAPTTCQYEKHHFLVRSKKIRIPITKIILIEKIEVSTICRKLREFVVNIRRHNNMDFTEAQSPNQHNKFSINNWVRL